MNSNIAIAFCFDENFWKYAGVTITSLLVNSKDKCAYDIYCVAPEKLPLECRESLTGLVEKLDALSTVHFLDAETSFNGAPMGGLTASTYYRLILAKLLPHLDRIIYADTDIIFLQDLRDLAAVDIADNIIAAVKAYSHRNDWDRMTGGGGVFSDLNVNSYVNAGLLIMNLKAIREGNFYDIWVELATKHKPVWLDQDILNLTCEGRKLFLHPKYNHHLASKEIFEESINFGIYSREEYAEAFNNPVALHFVSERKPWNSKKTSKKFGIWWDYAALWWEYAALTPFYKSLQTIRFPKAVTNFFCWFIPTKAKRRAFRKKYMYYG